MGLNWGFALMQGGKKQKRGECKIEKRDEDGNVILPSQLFKSPLVLQVLHHLRG
jgi:hypothetical protein